VKFDWSTTLLLEKKKIESWTIYEKINKLNALKFWLKLYCPTHLCDYFLSNLNDSPNSSITQYKWLPSLRYEQYTYFSSNKLYLKDIAFPHLCGFKQTNTIRSQPLLMDNGILLLAKQLLPSQISIVTCRRTSNLFLKRVVLENYKTWMGKVHLACC
jgi:hypothetical protein